MSDTDLLDAVSSTVRRFATERLAPATASLEKGASLWPLVRELRDLLGLEGLAELAVAAADRREEKARAAGDAAKPPRDNADPALFPTVMQELSRVNPGFALSVGASIGLCGQSILKLGTREQRQRWARPAMALEKIGCWGLTEPGAGSDAFGSMRTTARIDGDAYVLDGEKTFITNAPDAEIFVVYAKVRDGETERVQGFVLERGMPGLTTSAPFDKMGMRTSPTGSFTMDGVRVDRTHLLGGDPLRSGKRDILLSLFGERVALCAMAVGIIERSLEIALSYAKERKQFGEPIASFQAVQLRLARMYASQETVRALLEKAYRLIREGTTDAAFFCAAKYTASTLATEVALDAVQVLAGNGYMREYVVEMLARDAKLLEIGGGTSDVQLLTVARDLLARG